MENKKNSTGKTVTIVILIILLLGALGYIAYDKVFTKETKKPEKTQTKVEEQPKLLSNEEALEIGKKLYLEARDNVYKYYGTVLSIDRNVCYTYINNQMEQQNCDTVDPSNLYYKVSDKDFKNIFTQNGINQFEKFMTIDHTGKFIIYNNDYYIFGNISGQYTVDENVTKITVNKIEKDNIVFDVTETCFDLSHYAEYEAGNNQYGTQINSIFKIVKENDVWKIEDYTDAYTKYLDSFK